MRTFHKTVETFTPGAKTLPQKYFVADDIFAKERQNIFSREWLYVGHQSQSEHAGDYLLVEIAGESLIIVRDKKGQLHGFYNVCRHRGTRMCEEQRGQFANTIQCPYHAWTYGLDGRLLGTPHMEDVEGFDKAEHSLHAVSLTLWEGFIFVNLAEKPVPLVERFAPLEGKFSHWNLPKLRSAKTIEYDVRANWKLIFENYSECYHCPLVHPELSKLSPYDSAENDLCEGPFLGGFMPITRGNSLSLSGNACALPLGDIKAEDHHRVFYYSIFPNMLLSMHPDYVMVHQIWPRSPDRTLIVCDWFFHPDAFGRPDFKPADAIDFWDMTNRQDWHVCELSQQGIGSRAYKPGFYSPRESISAAWDREYLRAIGES
ncbi:MAG TPA: aromatic ring-hydroxylating dioxygenase subunit alpha [Candidatus Limnocylindrales bacterium]|jgi:Rieske 2Fe-2S family protein|nr:aromatic ring-hydroxylating dioxygenase subunit alpha [Candidatus Limnocylindrales bacterium]